MDPGRIPTSLISWIKRPGWRSPRLWALVFTHTIVTSCIVAIIGLTLAAGWVMMSPRQMTFLVPTIKAKLNKQLHQHAPHYRVDIQDASIFWNRWKNSIEIQVESLALLDSSKTPLSHFPEVQIGFSILDLLSGTFAPSDITLVKPVFKARISSHKETTTTQTSLTYFLAPLYTIVQNRSPHVHGLNNIAVQDARLQLTIDNNLHVIQINEGYGKAALTTDGQVEFKSQANITLHDKTSSVDLTLVLSQQQTASVSLTVNDLPTKEFFSLLPVTLQARYPFLLQNDMTFDGEIVCSIDEHGIIRLDEYHIHDARGMAALDMFEELLPVESLQISGKLGHDNTHMATIDSLKASIDGAPLLFTGSLFYPDGGSNFQLKGKAVLQNVPIEALPTFWPTSLASKSRKWALNHLHHGMIESADLSININQADILNKTIPQHSLASSIVFSGLTIDRIQHLAPITNLKGHIQFSGQDMNISVSEGNVLDSTIHSGSVRIPSFEYGTQKSIEIEANLSGLASNLLTIYQNLPHTPSWERFEGLARSNVSLAFPLKPELTPKDISLNASVKLDQIHIPNVSHSFDLTEGDFILTVKNQLVNIRGYGRLNTIPAELSIAHDVSQSVPTHEFYLKTFLTEQDRHILGVASPYIQDVLGVKLYVHDQHAESSYNIELDLTQANITIPYLEWSKQAGAEAHLKAKAKIIDNKFLDISGLDISGDNVSIQGSLQVPLDFVAIKKMQIDRIKFGQNDFSLSILPEQNQYNVLLKGKSLDLSQANFFSSFKQSGNYSIPYLFNANIEQVFLKENQSFSDVEASIACNTHFCERANIIASIGETQSVVMSLSRQNNQTNFFLESDNAGAVIAGTGVSKNIEGGSLEVHATPLPGKIGQLKGNITLRDFSAVKTPILAKLLTLSSLPGILNRLNNQGIPFKKATIPFTFEDNQLLIKEATSSGGTLGLTSEGWLNFNSQTLGLEGVIVPSYIIPTEKIQDFISNIPLIGDLLVGGKGEGIFAFSYKITGNLEKPKVDVNPASILAPGVFRNILSHMIGGKETASTTTTHPTPPVKEKE